MIRGDKMTLNAKNLGLAGGIVWGAGLFALTLLSMATGYGLEFLTLLGTVYHGYKISIVGGLIGAVYGFVDAFLGLYVFAWVYNKLEARK